MGAPSNQFLRLLWRPPSVCFFCILYRSPSDQFLCILYWGPQLTFFASYMGPLRSASVSSLTIWGLTRISFFAYYMGAHSDQFLRLLYGGPHRSVSSLPICSPPPPPPPAPNMSVSSLTIRGPLDYFFIFYALNYSWGGPIFLNFQGWQVPPLAPPPAGAHGEGVDSDYK